MADPAGMAPSMRGRRPGRAWSGAVRAGQLLVQAEVIAYYLVVAPLCALLPARLAYRAACLRGDWTFRTWKGKRGEVLANLSQVLGDQLSPAEAKRLARDVFRIRSCEVIDLMLLRGQARSLGKLTEIRGREHLAAAIDAGKGAILCSPHSGSYLCAQSLLQADGFKVTTMGRWWWRYPPGQAPFIGRVWEYVYARRILRHRQRPNIEPWPGRMGVAVQAAAVLRDNEVMTICSDAPPLDSEMSKAVEVPFLGRPGKFMPGVITLAKLTGAPVLMASVHRTADYRHQVLEISPPMPVQGDAAAAFERCVAAMGAAVAAHPADWDFWFETDDLARLGLLPDGTATAAALTKPQAAAR
jgi:lauroyl/myristoyl acyltransferase